jgi:hypothetical protein
MSLLSAPGPAHSVPGGVGLDWNAYSESELARRAAAAPGAPAGPVDRQAGTTVGARSVTWSDFAREGGGFTACFQVAFA